VKPQLKPPQEAILTSAASSAAELLARLLTLGLSILTARLLEPRDIGVLGLAVMVSAIVSMMGAYAETAGVIVRAPSSDSTLCGAAALWRGGVTLVLILVVQANLTRMGTLVAPGAGPYFERVAGPMLLVPAVETLAAHPRVFLQRRLRLRFVIALQFLQALSFAGVGAALVLAGHGVWGVVWAQIISTTVTTTVFWVGALRCDRVGPAVSRDALRAVGRSAAKLFTGGFAGFLSERVDNFLVGGALGPASMSYYSMAWTASRTPVFVLSKALSAVMLPMLPRSMGDLPRAEARVQLATRYTMILATITGAGLFAVSRGATEFVLGAKWLPLVPSLRIMCLTISLTPLILIAATLLSASGNAHLVGAPAAAHIAALAVLIPALCARYGIAGAAMADLLATLLTTAILATVVRRRLSGFDWVQPGIVLRALAAGTLAAAITHLLIADRSPLFATMTLRGLLALTAYVAFSWPLGLLLTLKEIVASLRSAAAAAVGPGAGVRLPGQRDPSGMPGGSSSNRRHLG
jgi:O-antigen/teichoic acid export membrane protein